MLDLQARTAMRAEYEIALTTGHCKGMAARSDVDEIRLHHSSRYMLRVRHFTDQDAALQTLLWQTLTS